MNAEDATSYLYSIIKEGEVHRLKVLLKEIQDDYENSSDYLLRHCNSVPQLESFLKEYTYLFMIENGKVARSTDELESGRENADGYFLKTLKKYSCPVLIEEFLKHVADAPDHVQHFLSTFYPETEFKRYLQRRPHLFVVTSTKTLPHTVWLTERECVTYFRKALESTGQGLRYTSLRGHIGQAPPHVRDFVNDLYPGTEFRHFLQGNSQDFILKPDGRVFLASFVCFRKAWHWFWLVFLLFILTILLLVCAYRAA